MGRDTRGVRGIELREGDHVIGMDVIEDLASQQVLCISANGYGKRTPLLRAAGAPSEGGEALADGNEPTAGDVEERASWRKQTRGGLGVLAMETSERNGPLVSLRVVRPEDQIMVITNGGQIIRTHVSEVREAGRNTQGVRILRVGDGERVVAVEPIAEDEEAGAEPLSATDSQRSAAHAPSGPGEGSDGPSA
ncbi:MAG: hypothetical protein OHK0013_23050 [Sandaracinaceae bacterium]